MPTDRLTDHTVLAAVQARPMTGDTITAARDYLACSAPTLAELLDVPADKILALEAAGPRGAVPDDLAREITSYVAECLDIMTPAELRSAREATGLTYDGLAAAISVGARRIQRAEDGWQMINETMRDRTLALAQRAEHDVEALTNHLRALATDAQPLTVWTYRNAADLTHDQAQLPPAPTSGTEDAVTALLRTAPAPGYHLHIAGRAARAAGARLRYR